MMPELPEPYSNKQFLLEAAQRLQRDLEDPDFDTCHVKQVSALATILLLGSLAKEACDKLGLPLKSLDEYVKAYEEKIKQEKPGEEPETGHNRLNFN